MTAHDIFYTYKVTQTTYSILENEGFRTNMLRIIWLEGWKYGTLPGSRPTWPYP